MLGAGAGSRQPALLPGTGNQSRFILVDFLKGGREEGTRWLAFSLNCGPPYCFFRQSSGPQRLREDLDILLGFSCHLDKMATGYMCYCPSCVHSLAQSVSESGKVSKPGFADHAGLICKAMLRTLESQFKISAYFLQVQRKVEVVS